MPTEYRFFNCLGVVVHTSYDTPKVGSCFTLDPSPESYEYTVLGLFPQVEFTSVLVK